jgi:cytochrome b6-f complex iron-sulfur subunit
MAADRETNLTRRRFCNTAVLVSAGLALAATDVKGQKPAEGQSLLAYPPVKIEGAERVMPGSSLYFDYPNKSDPAVLLRAMDGQYLAFSRKCAHLGCSIDFDKAQRCLVCPCHRGVYDARTGYVVYGPPPRPLDQIILQVRAGGEIWAVGRAAGGNQNASAGVRTNSGGSN